ncbi:MAG: hypothetical protein IIB23_02325 [Chloroflexi bacterium]|nr:hypothetical protein [Chloroflexota bacterium]MCH8064734.1 hypothetical protein [Chloroflexota bacterium]
MALLIFGFLAVTAMLVAYALEERSHWFVFVFAVASAAASAYGFLIESWPFASIEAIWSLVALRRWWVRRAVTQGA